MCSMDWRRGGRGWVGLRPAGLRPARWTDAQLAQLRRQLVSGEALLYASLPPKADVGGEADGHPSLAAIAQGLRCGRR